MDAAQMLAAASTAGVSTVIAIYMVWWATNSLAKRLDAIAEKLDEILQREERILGRLNGIPVREER